METFAQRLEKLRSEHNISRPDLAAALALPKSSIEKMETGRLTPSKEQLQKIAAYFGVTAAFLRGETENIGTWLYDAAPQAEPRKTESYERSAAGVSGKKSADEDNAVFQILLKSDSFRNAVLEILRSPEGQELFKKAAEKAARGY